MMECHGLSLVLLAGLLHLARLSAVNAITQLCSVGELPHPPGTNCGKDQVKWSPVDQELIKTGTSRHVRSVQ